MLSQVAKLSCRALRSNARGFSSAAPRYNLLSDLYVKELKAFKPTPLSAKDAETATKAWKTPAAPSQPAVEGDSADALSQYAQSEVDTAAPKKADATEDAATEDWFVFEEEEPHH